MSAQFLHTQVFFVIDFEIQSEKLLDFLIFANELSVFLFVISALQIVYWQ